MSPDQVVDLVQSAAIILLAANQLRTHVILGDVDERAGRNTWRIWCLEGKPRWTHQREAEWREHSGRDWAPNVGERSP